MKKHKSVVAILLAVMMIFTMMPTMAFAAKATGWGDQYATVTDEKGDEYKTVRTFTDGLIKAEATAEKTTVVVGQSDAVAPTDAEGNKATKYFYQLDGSALVYGGNAKNTLDGSTWTQEAFAGLLDTVGVKVVAPSYVEGYNAQNPATAVLTSFAGWTVKFKASDYDSTKTTEDQKITVSVEFTPNGEVNGTAAHPEKFGVVGNATITVKGIPTSPAAAKFYFDEVGGADLENGYYDGDTHTVVCDEVPGYTVSYEVYNATTGKWDAVSAVTINDVQKDAIQAKAIFKKGATDTQERTFTVNLKKAGNAKVGFAKSDLTSRGEYMGSGEYAEIPVYTVEGSTYDAKSYIDVIAEVTYSKYDSDTNKEKARRLDAATAKAVAANKADLIACFNELYEIKETTSKTNPNVVELSVDMKDLTSKERKAITDKYAAVLARMNVVPGTTEAIVALNGVDLSDYEIEFTNAPAKKVIKTKKAKSTKKVTFSVTAECKNGTIVKYKLINAPKKNITIDAKTGKITVKKGTPKGTYTFKVKAYIAGSSNYYDGTPISETQTIKVIVKKTKKK